MKRSALHIFFQQLRKPGRMLNVVVPARYKSKFKGNTSAGRSEKIRARAEKLLQIITFINRHKLAALFVADSMKRYRKRNRITLMR